MNNVVAIRPEAALQAIERMRQHPDNQGHVPPTGGGGEPPMDARITKLEGIAEKTGEKLATLEKDVAIIKSNYATKEDLSRVEGSIRADMHKEFTTQTWRIIGAMLTFGALLSAAVFFIARNVKP